jgi:putative tricarboxylic transport membrane protein
MNLTRDASLPSPALGLFLTVLGAAILFLARQIPHATLGETNDPGPRAFPVALGIALLAGGVWECVHALVKRKGSSWSHGEASEADAKPWFILLLLLGLSVYIVGIGWLGFAFSTVVFSTVVMWRLGTRWWRALLIALFLTAGIQLLFVRLFKVPLPGGIHL